MSQAPPGFRPRSQAKNGYQAVQNSPLSNYRLKSGLLASASINNVIING
jgi:hypothetical protein